MNKKQVIRTAVFVVLVFAVLVFLSHLFEYEVDNISRRYDKFKDLEKGTVDAVYIGSSGVDRYWIGAKAYEDYGMTVYPLSSEGLPSWLVKNMIVEAVNRQNPELLIIDTRPFTTSEAASTAKLADVRCRRVIDTVDYFSANRLDAIKTSVEEMSKIDTESTKFDLTLSFYFSFIRYHNKWSDESFTFDDLNPSKAAYLGFYLWKGSSVKEYSKARTPEFTSDRGELDEVAEKYLRELIAYIKENKLNVLFVDTPYALEEEGAARRNTIFDILDENGMVYVTYNTNEMYELLGMDFKHDYYNKNHVNYYGAEKFTEHFAEYLHQNYELADHRADARCTKDWEGVYAKIKNKVASFEKDKNK